MEDKVLIISMIYCNQEKKNPSREILFFSFSLYLYSFHWCDLFFCFCFVFLSWLNRLKLKSWSDNLSIHSGENPSSENYVERRNSSMMIHNGLSSIMAKNIFFNSFGSKESVWKSVIIDRSILQLVCSSRSNKLVMGWSLKMRQVKQKSVVVHALPMHDYAAKVEFDQFDLRWISLNHDDSFHVDHCQYWLRLNISVCRNSFKDRIFLLRWCCDHSWKITQCKSLWSYRDWCLQNWVIEKLFSTWIELAIRSNRYQSTCLSSVNLTTRETTKKICIYSLFFSHFVQLNGY